MATSLLVQSGSAVLSLDYSFIYPPSAAAWAMDRFIPSSRQPQHWSRNYHGSQERRRSIGRRRGGSPDFQEKDASSYRQGVTLRAEDLLVDSENKLGTGNRLSPSNHITPRPGDGRRALVGGSANELATTRGAVRQAQREVRRSSEGGNGAGGANNHGTRPKSSSSSSNAADDPTSSDASSSCTSTSSSSSSESGCNGDSETCNYCRLSESSEARESSSSSTEDGRTSSPSPPKLNNGSCRRLARALSEDCYPPSRPIRRTSPGEYLRHKRDQMDRMRQEPTRRSQRPHPSFQRCDSDPRLSTRGRQLGREPPSPSRTLTFASPTRNRITKKTATRKKGEGDQKVEAPVARQSSPAAPKNNAPEKRSSRSKDKEQRRSSFATSSVVWSSGAVEESTPFLASRRGSFRCAVCDCDIPFTNCVLCNAEAKGAFLEDGSASSSEVFFTTEADLVSLASGGELVLLEEEGGGDSIRRTVVELTDGSEKKELEEFYDRPTPVEPPQLPTAVQQKSTDEKRTQWTSTKGAVVHKSFNHEEQKGRGAAAARRSSLRKYNSEPVPETGDFQYSGEQSEAGTPSSSSQQQGNGRQDQKAESSASSASRSESRTGYIVAKDSPRKDSPQQQKENGKGCHFCGKTTEDEDLNNPDNQSSKSDADKGQQRKSPVFLKPQFNFEPEIIHKANPLVDETDVDVLPSAVGAFRRLSEEEFISTLNIHEAAKKGDLHVVKLLTKKDPKQMETVDERGWTPIHLAAAHGHTEVVKFLAMEGAHLAALDPSSYTAIHLASMNGHNSCLEVLLPLGVDVDSVTSEGFTALHLAVMNCHLDCIQTLLQWGASLDKRDALGRGINDMVEEYNLQDVAVLLRRFHKQLHNFKHMLDMMNREGKNASEMPREYMDILASIAEESGTE